MENKQENQLDANLVIEQLQQQLADANYKVAILSAQLAQNKRGLVKKEGGE